MTTTLILLQIIVQVLTLVGIGYTLYRMIAITAEAREARAIAVATTVRVEDAARMGASHAADAVIAIANRSLSKQPAEPAAA